MEYIVIALLVAAAVVALVMVFGGNLRNMLGKTNATLVQKTPEGAKGVGDQLRAEQEALDKQNKTAIEAGCGINVVKSDVFVAGIEMKA